jgi:hypothetical protein
VSKTVLIVAIVGSFLVVGAIAAVTATVIDTGDGGGTRVVRLQAAPLPGPGTQVPAPGGGVAPLVPGRGILPGLGQGLLQQLPKLRTCLQQQGIVPGRGALPDLQKLGGALKTCLGASATG